MQSIDALGSPDGPHYFHLQEALARVNGNKALLQTLLSGFLSSPLLTELPAQLSSGDFPAAAFTAHALKGLAGNLALAPLARAAASIETQLRAGQLMPESVLCLSVTIRATCHEAAAALRAL